MKGMGQDSVDELAQVVDLAPAPRVRIGWERVENKLGRRLPSDYKAFAERFGPGHFEEYVWVAVPRGFGDRLDFFGQLEQSVETLRSLAADGIPVPYPLYPEKGGLISWGSTIDGEVLYWRTDDDDPDRWSVVLHLTERMTGSSSKVPSPSFCALFSRARPLCRCCPMVLGCSSMPSSGSAQRKMQAFLPDLRSPGIAVGAGPARRSLSSVTAASRTDPGRDSGHPSAELPILHDG